MARSRTGNEPKTKRRDEAPEAAPDASVAEKAHAALDEVAELKAAASTCWCWSSVSAALKFPGLAVLSFAIASMGYSFVGEYSNGALATVSRSQETWSEVAVLAGWRLIELALAWFGGLDALDVAAMDLLSHAPALYLLAAFYSLSPLTALAALTVDVASAAVPVMLLRPLTRSHRLMAKLHNSELVDLPLYLYTTALATGIYTVVLMLSMRFILPRILVLHFSGLPSLEAAYTASYASLLPVTLFFGAAASTFIFAPFAMTAKSEEDKQVERFDPVTATLGQTFWWNVWGYTSKTKVIILRTAATVFATGVNTYLACTRTMFGVEPTGATLYAAVWVSAALCTGFGLGLVGGD
ncbi:hypothetical protein CDD82_3847 [Ophiocordyceps australis]|uniref:Uncharacterized protein n=1 Tax=Ophiocordyceps australis TaxID=1399860 RepID=A0A2C5ZM08_9HYPO|nr:hypothetical protein CDD82_3847 [Ophiocordyceps australis]